MRRFACGAGVKLSIVIPAYNEEATIVELLRRVRAADIPGFEREIIVVDDGSADRTAQLAREVPGVVLVRHARNAGKGAAIGAGAGAMVGGIRQADQQRQFQQQQQAQAGANAAGFNDYNRAMAACLQGRGYTVN